MAELIRPLGVCCHPAGLDAFAEVGATSPPPPGAADRTAAWHWATLGGRSLEAAILESAPDAVVATDAQGRVALWNPAAERILGYAREEALGRPIVELIIPEGHREANLGGLAYQLAAGRPAAPGRRVEVEAMRADGSTFPAELTITAIGGQGGPPMFAAFLRNVSERREAEDTLRQSEARLQTVLDSSEAVAYLKDLEGRYLLINRRWAELFGVTKATVVGKTDRDIFPAEIADAFRANDLRALEAGRAIELEEVAPHADGLHTYLSIKVPLYDPSGAAYATCGISTDITARKRVEEALRQSEERFRRAFDSAAIGMALVDPDGRWVRVNHALCATVGRSEEELLATTFQAITHPDDLESDLGLVRRLLAGEIPHFQMEKRYIHKSGHPVWVLLSVSLVRDADGRPVQFVSQIEDITPRKRAEDAIAERARLAELGSEVGIALTRCGPLREVLQRSAESLVRHLDAAFARIWTLEPGGEALELQASAGMYTHVDGPHARIPVGRCKIGQIAEEQRPLLTNAVAEDPRFTDREWATREGMAAFAGYPLLVDGRLLGVMAVFARRPLPEHTLQAMHSVANGIALAVERKQAEAMLAHQATHDGLTGLPNRTLLLQCLERATTPGRGADARCALLLLDLDRFKEINDTFGHYHGDEVLKQLNPRLLGAVRPPDLVARLGGDEFGILLSGADEEEALRVADRMLASLGAPIVVEGRALDVGASIGIALYPDHGTDASSLLQRADIAMYAAKRGRSGRVVYAPGLSECTPERLALVGELRRGIEGGQLLLHDQPKVDLATGRFAGAEALVRWLHPRDGLIPPGRFMPLAEEAGLIRPLGLWTLNSALLQCRRWRDAGLVANIAVNLSPSSLRDELLAGTIRELLASADAQPEWLTLEVTETAMMQKPARVKKVLEGLHEMGIRISIDDFGTGYSSLAFLKELPVDEVKVDRSFVRDMLGSERDSCIVRAVIDLGHNLGLRVVAEGVEDRACMEQLASWGCDSAQGYYLCPPLPPTDFTAWQAGRGTPASIAPLLHPDPTKWGRPREAGPAGCRAGRR